MKIVVTGAAGLIGQNLIARLKQRGSHTVVGIDKHKANIRILREFHPDIQVVEADMAEPGSWEQALDGANSIVVGHAQIGGLAEAEFTRNNLMATRRLLDAVAGRGGCHLVHISSSVVNSVAADWYTETKKAQEAMVLASANPTIVLRPTLMSAGSTASIWLAGPLHEAGTRVPDSRRRPLRSPTAVCRRFLRDHHGVPESEAGGTAYNISGLERIDYIDLMRMVREAVNAKAPIVKIPYGLFRFALSIYAVLDKIHPSRLSNCGRSPLRNCSR